jgi:hypothetical protein
MAEEQPNADEIFFQEMKSILKPMIDSAKLELPKDPVIKNKIIHIFINLGCIYDTMVTKLFRDGRTWGKYRKNRITKFEKRNKAL